MENYLHGKEDRTKVGRLESGKDALEVIFTRGSIRRFEAREIEKELMDALLYAGFCAPSARNIRPYEIAVITGEKKKAIASFSRQPEMMQSAAALICVCGCCEKQPNFKFLTEDCAAVTQNILLAAHALGLGAVWCGVGRSSDWEQALSVNLKLPDNVLPMTVITLGYPAEQKTHADRFEAFKLHYNEW